MGDITTVTIDADVNDDTPQSTAVLEENPEKSNRQTALALPPLLSKALSFLLHLATSIMTYTIDTYVWPFGSVSLVLMALSSPFIINLDRWWNKALDEAIGIKTLRGTEGPLAKAAWDKAWS